MDAPPLTLLLLPQEVLFKILHGLVLTTARAVDVPWRVRESEVCSAFRDALDHDVLWIPLFARDLKRVVAGNPDIAVPDGLVWISKRADVIEHYCQGVLPPNVLRGVTSTGGEIGKAQFVHPRGGAVYRCCARGTVREAQFYNPEYYTARSWSGGGPLLISAIEQGAVRARYLAANRAGNALKRHHTTFACRSKYDGPRVRDAVKAAGGFGCVAEPTLIGNWLGWLGDPNWPSAGSMQALFLSAPRDDKLAPFILDFLEHYDRGWLNYYMQLYSHHYHASFRPELLRLATAPTEEEVGEDLPEDARDLLEEKGDWHGGV